MSFIPRLEFAAAVRKHEAERHARGFSCWTQLVSMLFCQLGRAQSVALLRHQLFVYRDLTAWLNAPFEPPD